ncbi:MAG: hypothetical protein CVV24_08905 [Ignavibacteriae bacterium HGW-Ignavibacteriae-3]|nr:MAG: hypothetical protein CVV24_08905 [Ignavibacteriae bacterium HGW-Ignavibacteriae-3]
MSLSLTIGLNAQTQTPRVTERQEIQKEKIEQGVKSGELTRHETKQLVKQQVNIQINKRASKSDGVVTKRERAKLDRMQDKAAKNIYK